MKFDYKNYGANTEGVPTIKPIIPITLKGSESIRYEVLVDSGADICIFDLELAELIGIDVRKGEKVLFAGVTGSPRIAYMHDVEIEVGGHVFKAHVSFATLPPYSYGIVGQRGFFDHFKVIFDYQKKQVELREKTPQTRRIRH
jgi:Aspartyl protease